MFFVLMKRKCIYLIVFVMIFQVFTPSFLFAQSTETTKDLPAVCSGPSEMMSQYFNFQREIKTALLSNVDEKRYNVSMWRWWIFTHDALPLPSALDFMASNLRWSTKSSFSTAITSMVLLLLMSSSVLQSNTEWLAILFKDRPIVRDYKELLDIETELFDVAYFQSQAINLLNDMDGGIYKKMGNVIDKYKESWLLWEWLDFTDNSVSMADVLEEMLSMNSYMKHFILYPGENTLNQYYWCFWSTKCGKEGAFLKFDKKAIEQLDKDYSNIWIFWACNQYASNFKNSISKSFKNNSDNVSKSYDHVKDAIESLKKLMVWKWWGASKNKSRCDLSDYEMAQLRAYWWAWWPCNEKVVSVQSNLSNILNSFVSEKSVQEQQRENSKTSVDQFVEKNAINWNENLEDNSKEKINKDYWYKNFVEGSNYSVPFNYEHFNMDMYNSFIELDETIKNDYEISQNNAISSDLSYELIRIRGVLEQLDSVIKVAEQLREQLKKISDYQC